MQTVNKHMQRYSTSLVIGGMQTKDTRCHYTPTRMAGMKEWSYQLLAAIMWNNKFLYTAGGNV